MTTNEVTAQKTIVCTVIAVETSKLTYLCSYFEVKLSETLIFYTSLFPVKFLKTRLDITVLRWNCSTMTVKDLVHRNNGFVTEDFVGFYIIHREILIS